MIKAGIIGATGYAGGELVRLLLNHKEVEIKWYGSRSYIDKKYYEVTEYVPLVDDKCMDDNMEGWRIGGCDFYRNTPGPMRLSCE